MDYNVDIAGSSFDPDRRSLDPFLQIMGTDGLLTDNGELKSRSGIFLGAGMSALLPWTGGKSGLECNWGDKNWLGFTNVAYPFIINKLDGFGFPDTLIPSNKRRDQFISRRKIGDRPRFILFLSFSRNRGQTTIKFGRRLRFFYSTAFPFSGAAGGHVIGKKGQSKIKPCPNPTL